MSFQCSPLYILNPKLDDSARPGSETPCLNLHAGITDRLSRLSGFPMGDRDQNGP